jgi:hypothetical protein
VTDATDGTGPEDEEPTVVDHPTSASGVRARWSRKGPDEADEVQHSALVGFMSVPVGRRFPLRRSTLVLVVAFLGLGTVLYFNPPQSDTVGKGAVVNGYYVPGAVPVSTTTTTTTSPPPATTVPPTSTTTSRAPTSTPTAPPFTGTSTTTLGRGPTATTTTVSGGGASGTTPTVSTSPGTSGAGGFGGAGTTTTSTTG